MSDCNTVTVGRISSHHGSFTPPVSPPPPVSCTGGGNELEEEAAMSKCRHWAQNHAGDLKQWWRKEADDEWIHHARNTQVDKLCVRVLVCTTWGEGWDERWAGPVAAGFFFYIFISIFNLSPSCSLFSCGFTRSLSRSRSLPPPPSAFVVVALCRAFLLLSVFLSSPPASTVSPRFFSHSNGINNSFRDFLYLPLHCSSRFAGF